MMNVVARSLCSVALLLGIAGIAQADSFNEMELTIRVMESDRHGVRDLINEIELPKSAVREAAKKRDSDKNDKDKRGDKSSDRDRDEERHGDRDDDRDDHDGRRDDDDSRDDHHDDKEDGMEGSKDDD